jgi:hypothetical protein
MARSCAGTSRRSGGPGGVGVVVDPAPSGRSEDERGPVLPAEPRPGVGTGNAAPVPLHAPRTVTTPPWPYRARAVPSAEAAARSPQRPRRTPPPAGRPREQGRHPLQHRLLGGDPLAQPDSRQDLRPGSSHAAASPDAHREPERAPNEEANQEPSRAAPTSRPTSSVRRCSANADEALADLGYDADAIRKPPSLDRGEDGAMRHPVLPEIGTHSGDRAAEGLVGLTDVGLRPGVGSWPRGRRQRRSSWCG